ncbi:hypothetical protein [Arthrobacter sp. A2-55]|uniref:hypothetical protein n=1 Tax=Arthrobacter sp. A2-55 TaxID=2897337 RepID=UPI0021CD264A|nr:hypothetical protein [Arthrobacter sp. A2-55]MCU6480539.1 hypothetical protein [Arthrobacter sp. A2-55]
MSDQQAPSVHTAEELAASRAWWARERRAKQIAGRDPAQCWPTTMLAEGPDGRSAVIWLRELAEAELAAEAQPDRQAA